MALKEPSTQGFQDWGIDLEHGGSGLLPGCVAPVLTGLVSTTMARCCICRMKLGGQVRRGL